MRKTPSAGSDGRSCVFAQATRQTSLIAVNVRRRSQVFDFPKTPRNLERLVFYSEMSEYWKSTPNYWCKFCQTYVRDTKLERAKHEATGKHKGSIDRHLRGIQKEEDQKERDKSRVENEVARLKKLTGQKVERPSSSANDQPDSKKREPRRQTAQQVTIEERIRQAESAAALGIAIPEELRPHMSLAGTWQVMGTRDTSQQNTAETVKSEQVKPEPETKKEDGDAEDTSPVDSRKRRPEADEEVDKPRKRALQTYATEADKAKADKEIDSIFASFGTKKEEELSGEEKPVEPVKKTPVVFKRRARPTATMVSQNTEKEDAAA